MQVFDPPPPPNPLAGPGSVPVHPRGPLWARGGGAHRGRGAPLTSAGRCAAARRNASPRPARVATPGAVPPHRPCKTQVRGQCSEPVVVKEIPKSMLAAKSFSATSGELGLGSTAAAPSPAPRSLTPAPAPRPLGYRGAWRCHLHACGVTLRMAAALCACRGRHPPSTTSRALEPLPQIASRPVRAPRLAPHPGH